MLVGPEVNHIGELNNGGLSYMEAFLENERNSINYFSWHQYYLNGHEAEVNDFINPMTFYTLPIEIESMWNTMKKSRKFIPMWLCKLFKIFNMS